MNIIIYFSHYLLFFVIQCNIYNNCIVNFLHEWYDNIIFMMHVVIINNDDKECAARNPDSIPIDFTDCYDVNTHSRDKTDDTSRVHNSSGMECGHTRGGTELNSNWPMTR